MSTRSTRRPQSTPALSSIESLLLAQATWEMGAAPDCWWRIAKLLSKHPLLSRPKSFFTPQSCHLAYEALLKEAGLELNESNYSAHAPTNLQLAEKHYQSRFQELRELILAEETKFKTALKEIEEIRAGSWDKDFQGSNAGQPSRDASTLIKEPATKPYSDETFGGSELSGVTESADSAASSQLQDKNVSVVHERGSTQLQAKTELPNARASLTPALTDNVHDTTAVINGHTLSSTNEENDKIADKILQPNTTETSPLTENDVADTEDVEMEKVEAVQDGAPSEYVTEDHEHAGKRQEEEEEEEETRHEEENKEEEEETPQGQEIDTDQNESEAVMSPKSVEPSAETESEPMHTPAAETVASDADATMHEGQSAEPEEQEELVMPTRRSSRRRKSSATSAPPPLPTRTRLRARGRISGSEPRVADSDNDGDADPKEDTPADDERISSPFEGGASRRRDGKRKASFVDSVDSPQDKKRLREDSEPAEEEDPGLSSHNTRARVTRHTMRTEEQVALKRFQNVIGMLHSQISQHRNGTIFHNPIKNSEAPDYHEIVKRPMDLKTIKTRVKDGAIGNSLEFQRDIYLMFANAMMYNRPGSDVHAMAEDMMLESEGQINAFRQTEGLVKRGQRP